MSPIAIEVKATVRFPFELHDRLYRLARQDCRSFTNEVLFLIERALSDYQPRFPDGFPGERPE